MGCKGGQIVCDGKEVATIECSDDGITLKLTDVGKNLCAEFGKGCC